ncbi:MAG: hypothetical protein ACJAYE_002887 [Candidatus Azotimanducaceae bacterium]|jgi:hypothetical protein
MMKTLNIVLLGTFLASSFAVNAAADNRHTDRFQFKVYDELVAKHLKRISHKKQTHQNHQNHQNHQKNHDQSYSNSHSKKHNKKHNRKYSNGHSNGYSQGHSKGHSNYDDRRNDGRHNKRHHNAHKQGRWETIGSFRGRSGQHVTRQIHVDERVRALSLQGTKRGMVVRRAHALLGNGRWVRIEGLEGHLRHGEQTKHRLRKPRHIQKIVLDIAPDRYKRGYADLRIKSAG